MSKISKIAILILITLFLSEAMLRLQQKLGPIYDLGFQGVNYDYLSDIYNHKNIPLDICTRAGKKLIRFYDSDGIRINKLRPDFSQRKDAFKILFMGDSFMEGFDDAHTIPQNIWEYMQGTELRHRPIALLNSGCKSYSTAIFIPQAKYLIPKIEPDFVVVDIDETDLEDDYTCYKDLIVRDSKSRIAAVRHTPIFYKFYAGFLKIRKQPLYLTRLFSKLFHTRVYMPWVTYQYHKKDILPKFSISQDKDHRVREKYAKEIAFFENNVRELTETLINLMGEKRRILLIYHPHLGHIKLDSGGHYWNNFISSIVREASEKYGVSFYNATDDLKKAFKDGPEKYYLKKDMHFNFEGLKIYSNFVAERLLPLIEPLVREKQK